MSDFQSYRRKADELLRQATAAKDLNERSRLITEATNWHMKSLSASGQPPQTTPSVDGAVIPFPTEPQEPEAS